MKGVLQMSLVVAVFAGSHSLYENRAWADGCSENDQDTEGEKKRDYKTIVGPDGRKTFVIEKAFVVCGKVPRPNVFFLSQATSINYEWENLKKDFLPRIRQSVKKAPF